MPQRFLFRLVLCLLACLAGNLPGSLAAQAPAVVQDTAEVLYRFPSGGLISTGPVARAGLVWYLTDSRTLHVLDENGTALGKRTMSGRQLAFIVCDPFGRALVPEGNSSIMLLNRSGQAVWTWRLPQPLQYPPVFDAAGRIYLLAGRTLQLLAPNGSLLWQRELPEACSAAPLPGSAESLLLAFQGGLVQFWSGDGVLLGETRLNGELEQAAAFSGGYCLAAGGRLHWLDSTGQDLVAKQAEAAEAAGAADAGTVQGSPQRLPALTALLVQDELAWCLATDGRLQAWTVDNLLTSDTTTPHRNGRLVYKGGKLLLLSTARAGSYNLKGELLRELRLVNNASDLQVGDSGALFAGGRDWILYAYR
ncbi:MAG: PQQ-binding-like beta-propeller repeat protein, partial [Spirochaetes bacterium]|nr:PQQ-binding-like beta-propeller repeat protein [Spirochaetota bacterium]MBU0956400.1 PQQ-binding-like beta-propeller repeat protein [Spirochaetota bacterium]